ncbi:unnamed protein product [Rodentolepis nana]|uniref:TM2 domain-containing protein n=1 Tax=Rodentolepis nana TaxID=102285 RepID=A0A0R3TWK7_RODNA|nr:unnamed protein product [Rodentolepis nana]
MRVIFVLLCFNIMVFGSVGSGFRCSHLLPGQYKCDEPHIFNLTQEPIFCSDPSGITRIKCYPAPGISCADLLEANGVEYFFKNVTCLWTNGYNHEIALLLSIFGGLFGLDRFYLGYIALGSLKMWSIGGLGLWYLVDLILLVTDNLHPADHSNLTHLYYNPPLSYIHDGL